MTLLKGPNTDAPNYWLSSKERTVTHILIHLPLISLLAYSKEHAGTSQNFMDRKNPQCSRSSLFLASLCSKSYEEQPLTTYISMRQPSPHGCQCVVHFSLHNFIRNTGTSIASTSLNSTDMDHFWMAVTWTVVLTLHACMPGNAFHGIPSKLWV